MKLKLVEPAETIAAMITEVTCGNSNRKFDRPYNTSIRKFDGPQNHSNRKNGGPQNNSNRKFGGP